MQCILPIVCRATVFHQLQCFGCCFVSGVRMRLDFFKRQFFTKNLVFWQFRSLSYLVFQMKCTLHFLVTYLPTALAISYTFKRRSPESHYVSSQNLQRLHFDRPSSPRQQVQTQTLICGYLGTEGLTLFNLCQLCVIFFDSKPFETKIFMRAPHSELSISTKRIQNF